MTGSLEKLHRVPGSNGDLGSEGTNTAACRKFAPFTSEAFIVFSKF
jgi:hypothetical protein